MKAIWNNAVLAESEDTVIIEGNHYFPKVSIDPKYFAESSNTTHCPWKGEASYFTIVVEGQENKDAAWYYADPKPAAAVIKDHIAFWKGVDVRK